VGTLCLLSELHVVALCAPITLTTMVIMMGRRESRLRLLVLEMHWVNSTSLVPASSGSLA
jgi:hypothetical protein